MKLKAIIIFSLLSLSLTGCGTGDSVKPAAKPKPSGRPLAHSIEKSEERLLLKHARENLSVITKAGKNPELLKKALAGRALKEMTERVNADNAAGKVKVRRYDNLKLSLVNYTKGVAGVGIAFTDNSYLTKLETGKALDKPSGKKLYLLLAMKKLEGRWIIFEIFSNKVKKPTG